MDNRSDPPLLPISLLRLSVRLHEGTNCNNALHVAIIVLTVDTKVDCMFLVAYTFLILPNDWIQSLFSEQFVFLGI